MAKPRSLVSGFFSYPRQTEVPDPGATVDWPIDWLRRWTGLMATVLIAATWPLWWGGAEFPMIPVASWFARVPLSVDRICCALLLFGLTLLIIGNQRGCRWGWLVVLTGGIVLGMLNQHRWQPWFYQLLLYAAIFSLGSRRIVARCLIWLTISIYFYSALGKLDAEFLHSVGQQFFQEVLRWFGSARAAGEPWRESPIAIIAIFPLVELLLAVGLAWPKSRRVAGCLAIAFHLGLVALLGPLGLDHSAGVVCWNLQFAGQTLCLFALLPTHRRTYPTEAEPKNAVSRWSNRMAIAITVLAIAMPLGERSGLWDHWASWALYAPHSSRTEVWIAVTEVDALPTSLQRAIGDERAAHNPTRELPIPEEQGSIDDVSALWLRLPLERWSLRETRAPVYPQARFQLGVALALAARIDSEFAIKCSVRSAAARWDGRRRSREYEGRSSMASAARDYWLGTTAR